LCIIVWNRGTGQAGMVKGWAVQCLQATTSWRRPPRLSTFQEPSHRLWPSTPWPSLQLANLRISVSAANRAVQPIRPWVAVHWRSRSSPWPEYRARDDKSLRPPGGIRYMLTPFRSDLTQGQLALQCHQWMRELPMVACGR
jgi:hypothetical protein